MSKAKNCPKCDRFFNPKFGGQQFGNLIICTDCYVSEQIKFNNLNTALRNMATAPNKPQQ
jgi:hypothetical protein